MSPNINQTAYKIMNALSVDTYAQDTEYIILENIYDSSRQPLRQRDLAQIAGASLGMTNSILKRLAQKGWITVKKLNSRNIQYAITRDGINEIVHRSYRYFKRTIQNAVYFKDILEDVVHQAMRNNINKVILVGSSDLDFIVEHACRRWGLHFMKIPESRKAEEGPHPGALKIYAEGIPALSLPAGDPFIDAESPLRDTAATPDIFYLSHLIIKQAVAGANGG